MGDETIYSEQMPDSDRLRIRLVFKNEKLAEYAQQNLETHLVDAYQNFTVH